MSAARDTQAAADSGSAIELRLGRYQDVLGDVECDALICDPPYSERTHAGHDAGTRDLNNAIKAVGRRKADGSLITLARAMRRSIDYQCWTSSDVQAFVAAWGPRVRGWFVAISDHTLTPAWESALNATGRYVFAPVQFMAPGSRVRISGDGPALWSVSIIVARPSTRAYAHWGSLPGGYVLPPKHADRNCVIGGKPLWLMQALVRDYSRPGDLICDPCAGGATTLLAAAIEGRRAIGSEMDPVTHAKAQARIARGYTPSMFTGARARAECITEPQQIDLIAKTK